MSVLDFVVLKVLKRTKKRCKDSIIRFLVPGSIGKPDEIRENLLGIRTLGGKLVPSLQNGIELHVRSSLVGL